MLRVAGQVRNWSGNKDWGLKVPGRPPTPSEGAAQQYYRFGAANQQDILSFDNGTCLEFGPMDQVDEFILGYHPFSEQVALIDKSINDIRVVRDQYPDRGTQGDFSDFRKNRAPNAMVTFRNTDSGVYAQVPSKFCSVTDMISVYSPVVKVSAIGQALPAERGSDSRYGTNGRPLANATQKYPRRENAQQVPPPPAQDRPAQNRPTQNRPQHRPSQYRLTQCRPTQTFDGFDNARARRLQRRAAERAEDFANQRLRTGRRQYQHGASRHPPRVPQDDLGSPASVSDDFRKQGDFAGEGNRSYRPPDAHVNFDEHGNRYYVLGDKQMSGNSQDVLGNQDFQHGPPPGFGQQLPSECQSFHKQFNHERAAMRYHIPDYYGGPSISQSGGQIRTPPGFDFPSQLDTFPRGDEFVQSRGFADHRRQRMQDRGDYKAGGNAMNGDPRVEVMPATPERGPIILTASYSEPEEVDGQASIMSGRTSPLISNAAERRTTSQPVFWLSSGLLSAVMSQSNLSITSTPIKQNEGAITKNTPSRNVSRPASSVGFIRATSPSFQSVSDDMSVTGASSGAGDVIGTFLQAGNIPNTIFGEQPGTISHGTSPITSRGRGPGRRLYEQSNARGSTSNPGRVGSGVPRIIGDKQRSSSDEFS